MLMKTWWSDDAVMSSIFGSLTTHPDGIKQLRKHGLMGSMIEEDDEDDEDDDEDEVYDDGDVRMTNGEDTAGNTYGPSRRHQRSAEEQALRRRRREAMVLSEGGRPIGREDIIQRPIQDD